MWPEPEVQSSAFASSLTPVDALPGGDAKYYLRERVVKPGGAVRRLDRRAEERFQDEQGRRPLTGALFDHQRVHLEAELAWTRGVLERVQCGALLPD